MSARTLLSYLEGLEEWAQPAARVEKALRNHEPELTIEEAREMGPEELNHYLGRLPGIDKKGLDLLQEIVFGKRREEKYTGPRSTNYNPQKRRTET